MSLAASVGVVSAAGVVADGRCRIQWGCLCVVVEFGLALCEADNNCYTPISLETLDITLVS